MQEGAVLRMFCARLYQIMIDWIQYIVEVVPYDCIESDSWLALGRLGLFAFWKRFPQGWFPFG